MAAAAKQGQPHGMLSVIGLSDADLESVWPFMLTTLNARILAGVLDLGVAAAFNRCKLALLLSCCA